MGFATKILRRIILPAFVRLKADKVLFLINKKKYLVINFHGVRAKSAVTINRRHLDVLEFEKIIAYISKYFEVLPLSELIDRRRKKTKATRKTVALTFDDGYLNNFEIALPILKKYNVPATFYIISSSIEFNNFMAWPDCLDLYYHLKGESVKVRGKLFEKPDYRDAQTGITLADYLKTLGKDTVSETATILSSLGNIEQQKKQLSELLQLVNLKQLSEAAREPLLEIGSHSHSHFNMEYLEDQVAVQEFEHSKKLLENCIGKSVTSFAFPDGSYSPKTLQLALKSGYTDICAVSFKHTGDKNNLNLVSRYTISNSTTFESNILRMAKQYDKFGF